MGSKPQLIHASYSFKETPKSRFPSQKCPLSWPPNHAPLKVKTPIHYSSLSPPNPKQQKSRKMRMYTLALSPSKPLFNPLPLQSSKFSKLYADIKRCRFQVSCDLPKHGIFLPSDPNCRSPYRMMSCKRLRDFSVRSAAVPESRNEITDVGEKLRVLQLGAMFAVWYMLNIYFNIFNKQVLKVYPYPATVTAFQFGCGTFLILLMWALNLHPRPKVSGSQFAAIFPLALGHTAGNLLTNISLGKVAVSFTHTIKAMEPFFTVLLSALFFGQRPSIWVVSSLAPIVGGVALASFTEVSFNWIGFGTAMASNLTNQTRNVFSKKLMAKKEDTIDNINLFSIITIISFLLLAPAAVVMEGVKFSPSYLQYVASQGVDVKELCIRALLSGFCFHTYQQVSYMILGMVSPVTHAVGNSVKRVVVIVASVIFFRTPVSPVNALGTGLALVGVFLYSKAKRIKPKAS